jgi:hypothetical protein
VTCMTEDMAMRWLFNNPTFRNDFTREFFPDLAKLRHYFSLGHPFTRHHIVPGDIDLLLVHPDHPNSPIAFECKRVKIVAQAEGPPTVNRLSEIAKGIKQANGYQSLGFHQSYLLVILLDDGRVMATPNTMFRYAETAAVSAVYNIPWIENLHPDRFDHHSHFKSNTAMFAIGYARQSDKDSSANSIGSQCRRIELYCTTNHLNLVKTFVDAVAVRVMFKAFLDGTPFSLIQKMGKELGYRNKGNGAIQRLLKNPTYAGLVKVPAYKGKPSYVRKGIMRQLFPKKCTIGRRSC